MQNPHQAVGQLTQGLAVGLASGSELVVVAPCPRGPCRVRRTPTDRRRRPGGGCGRIGPAPPGCGPRLSSPATCRRSSCETWELEKRVRSSPNSPSTRAPRTVPSPGRERTTLASGCWSKCSDSAASSSAIWALKRRDQGHGRTGDEPVGRGDQRRCFELLDSQGASGSLRPGARCCADGRPRAAPRRSSIATALVRARGWERSARTARASVLARSVPKAARAPG